MMHDIIVRNGYGEDSFPSAEFEAKKDGTLFVANKAGMTFAAFAKGHWSAVIRAEREASYLDIAQDVPSEPWGPATTLDGTQFSAVDGECRAAPFFIREDEGSGA